MATSKEINTWLSQLNQTSNFEPVFQNVYDRILTGEGKGLIIIEGPSKKANKSFFLNTVKAFSRGVPFDAASYFSETLRRLLAKIETSHYQCVDMKQDSPLGTSDLYSVPLYLTMPLIIASACQQRGMKKGSRVVLLCDDLQKFLIHNEEKHMFFLRQIAGLTQNHGELTFLAAHTPTMYPDGTMKELKVSALSEYVMRLW